MLRDEPGADPSEPETQGEPVQPPIEVLAARVPTGEAPMVLWLLALVATVAALLSGVLERALPGVWLGVDHLITVVKLLAAATSQLFAVCSTAVIIGLVLATLRSNLPPHLRAYSVGAGALSILAVMIASAVKLPTASRLVLGASVSLLGLLAALPASRLYAMRAVALVVGVVSLAGMVRVLTLLVATYGGTHELVGTVARAGATLGLLLELAMVVLALLWATTQPRARGGQLQPLRQPRWGLLALGAAVCAALFSAAQLGSDPEATGALLLVSRAVDQLPSQPTAFGPVAAMKLLELMRWVAIVSLLVLAPRGRLMAAIVAFALLGRGTVEVALCAVSVLMAALALGLHPAPDLRDELRGRVQADSGDG